MTTAKFTISGNFNGHALAAVTCALHDQNTCYYRGPHIGGAIFVTFSGVPDRVFAPVSAERFIRITVDAIQQLQIDHKIFTESFLFQNGTAYEWSGCALTAHFEQDLRIEFEQADEFLRIAGIKTV
ncbi:MAG: hypothetical protein LBT26_11925 [Clostridiales Family XIII bacterium]|nr:hypothetical protein [Clostridiales Family XIII bacterium]